MTTKLDFDAEARAVLHSLQADGTVDRGRIADLIRALQKLQQSHEAERDAAVREALEIPIIAWMAEVRKAMPTIATDELGKAVEALSPRTDLVCVPRYPTPEMYDAFASVNCERSDIDEFIHFRGDFGNWVACYTAMLSAADDQKG